MSFAVSLVRFYLRWRQDKQFTTAADEVRAFVAWLDEAGPESRPTTEEIERLVAYHWSRDGGVAKTAGRREPRHDEQIPVLVNGDDGSSRARTRDVGVHGMRIVSEVPLPGDERLHLTVAPSGFPITIYHLEGMKRWQEHSAGGHTVGIEVTENRDFERWRDRFTGQQNASSENAKKAND